MVMKRAFLIFFPLFLLGCQNNDTVELKAELQELDAKLIEAQRSIRELESHNKILEKNLEEARFEYENLQIQKTETNEWTGYIIKGYGPCVWAGGPFERPIPVEPVEKGTPETLLAKLNTIFRSTDSPAATLLKIENGTVFIKIVDDEKLTQEMGTSGAANYINSIAYTLLSVQSIECVDLDFKEGDHAFPGTQCIKLNP